MLYKDYTNKDEVVDYSKNMCDVDLILSKFGTSSLIKLLIKQEIDITSILQ